MLFNTSSSSSFIPFTSVIYVYNKPKHRNLLNVIKNNGFHQSLSHTNLQITCWLHLVLPPTHDIYKLNIYNIAETTITRSLRTKNELQTLDTYCHKIHNCRCYTRMLFRAIYDVFYQKFKAQVLRVINFITYR